MTNVQLSRDEGRALYRRFYKGEATAEAAFQMGLQPQEFLKVVLQALGKLREAEEM